MAYAAHKAALGVAELRDMVFKALACPKTYCTLRSVSHDFASICASALYSIYDPVLFAKHFFDDAQVALQNFRENGALMAGLAVRSFIYSLHARDGWLVVAVKQDMAANVIDYIEANGYTCYSSKSFGDPLSPGPCRRPTAVHRFLRGKTHISVHISIHDPLRLLLAAGRPYAMQFCDGYRFCDLYPRLGENVPASVLCDGQHAHLLSPKECLQHMPPNAFVLDCGSHAALSTTYVERWIGDGNTLLLRNSEADPLYGVLERQGWTIRFNVERRGRRHLHHFWTDAVARCLRHANLSSTYVVPAPAMAYARRTLDQMAAALNSSPGLKLLGTCGREITDFDKELIVIFDHFRANEDYQYVGLHGIVAVPRNGCTYTSLGV